MDLTEHYKQQLQDANKKLKDQELELEKLRSHLRNAESIIADQDEEIDNLISRK